MAAVYHTYNILALWGHISAADQGIFMKFGEYVDNGLPKAWNVPNTFY